jgi:hypothetical protein
VIQNTNYNININNLSSKTPKQNYSKDKNISIKPIQINIFNNTNTPNQKKLNSNFVVVDYNIDVLRQNSKGKGSQNSSKEPIMKKKSLQNDPNKEIIRLYTSNSVNKKKIINQSDNFNINVTNKFKPPSIEKILPTSTKGIIQNMFSRLGINNFSNNLHKISKHSDNLFFKRKTDSSTGFDSVSPMKKTEGFKFNPQNEKKISLPINKQITSSNFIVKLNNPIKLSKPDYKLSQNVSGFEMTNSGRDVNESIRLLKDKVHSICLSNKIKVKEVFYFKHIDRRKALAMCI